MKLAILSADLNLSRVLPTSVGYRSDGWNHLPTHGQQAARWFCLQEAAIPIAKGRCVQIFRAVIPRDRRTRALEAEDTKQVHPGIEQSNVVSVAPSFPIDRDRLLGTRGRTLLGRLRKLWRHIFIWSDVVAEVIEFENLGS